ncbi:MAG: hypothetical protein KZQ59_03330, partial [Candidatus Thiodiazotropha sp. (ex Lucinoma aequizonata)]|nr:hypothetical protein [Candidatus Thiodiazotropha sp. (ex Lucinoma aequizonata)]
MQFNYAAIKSTRCPINNSLGDRPPRVRLGRFKRVFDLVKDFGTSQSTKIDSIFNSLLCPDR